MTATAVRPSVVVQGDERPDGTIVFDDEYLHVPILPARAGLS